MDICLKVLCTGCGACRDVCPKHCITMSSDNLSSLYPLIDNDSCIKCGKCQKTCPVNNPVKLNSPTKAYVAWSKDNETRATSASGGIASELYRYNILQNGISAGVTFNKDRGAYYIPITKEHDIQKVKNSKYVYSDTSAIFPFIKESLNKDKQVLFVGLPCQVAALKCFLKEGGG